MGEGGDAHAEDERHVADTQLTSSTTGTPSVTGRTAGGRTFGYRLPGVRRTRLRRQASNAVSLFILRKAQGQSSRSWPPSSTLADREQMKDSRARGVGQGREQVGDRPRAVATQAATEDRPDRVGMEAVDVTAIDVDGRGEYLSHGSSITRAPVSPNGDPRPQLGLQPGRLRRLARQDIPIASRRCDVCLRCRPAKDVDPGSVHGSDPGWCCTRRR